MDAVIRKWGNSPAIRIASAAMKTASFSLEQRVTVQASKGRIVIEPAHDPVYALDDLVAAITPKNVHDESDFGPPVGKESW